MDNGLHFLSNFCGPDKWSNLPFLLLWKRPKTGMSPLPSALSPSPCCRRVKQGLDLGHQHGGLPRHKNLSRSHNHTSTLRGWRTNLEQWQNKRCWDPGSNPPALSGCNRNDNQLSKIHLIINWNWRTHCDSLLNNLPLPNSGTPTRDKISWLPTQSKQLSQKGLELAIGKTRKTIISLELPLAL